MTKKKKEIVLLNISGDDKPGVTNALTNVLTNYNVRILDIGQAVIHETLDLGIMFEVPEEEESSPILKDLLFKSYELNIQAKFTPISEKDYNHWIGQQGKMRYIVTLIARKITAQQIERVTEVIFDQNLNIDMITRLSGRPQLGDSLQGSKACIEFSVRGTPKDAELMKSSFLDISKNIGADIGFQVDNIYRRSRRLICFDMDSTLIQAEVIDELAKLAGVGDQVAEITDKAMRGELSFKESFKKRISLLKGLEEKHLKDIAENLPLTEGSENLMFTLKRYGYKTAILSGGFTYFGKHLQNLLDIDYMFANELEIADGKLTGNYVGEIVDGEKKAELLKQIAFKEEIHLEQVIAVGDGSNDLPMLRLAGLGIAFHAKPKVKESAKNAISNLGLDGILYLLGFRDREILN
jgi:phosphoserine phosphatase